MSALVDELLKQAAILERHAFKTKCWPGDNDFEDAANPMRRAAAELTTLQSRLEAVKAERDAARELLTGEQQALDRTIDSYQSEYRKREAAEARVEELQKDRDRLDFLDACNQRLNASYGTNYRWELILNHNVNRLMLGHLNVDLNDAKAHGWPSCRDAIDREMLRVVAARALSPARTEEGKP
jgi:uncharacterized protein (DUF3084 family)